MANPVPIKILVGATLHRGYRDESGRFTLEQCNLDQVLKAREYDATALTEVPKGTTKCRNCWPNG